MSTSDDSARPLEVQVGGDHYKAMAIQPMEYSMANKLDACQHTIIKYVTRFRDKGGIQDLEKAKHCIDLLIHFERQSAALSFVDEAREFIEPTDVEPASAIDDDSQRMQAIGQQNQLDTGAMRFETVRDWVKWAWNGSFIPDNQREEAISAVKRSNGRLIICELGFQAGPFKDGGLTGKGCLNASPVGGPMLRCHDCIAEHCPCVAK